MTNKEKRHLYYLAHRHRKKDDPNYTPKTPKTSKERNRKYRFGYLDQGFRWEDVEGYDGFTINTVVHHRLEMFGFSRQYLIEHDLYYNCTPDELLCMSPTEHGKLHQYLMNLPWTYLNCQLHLILQE